jgi:predicted protein tyrosine phosphatase
MWSVLAALYPVQRDGERVWKCKGHDSDLNFKDISIPVKMDDIPSNFDNKALCESGVMWIIRFVTYLSRFPYLLIHYYSIIH